MDSHLLCIYFKHKIYWMFIQFIELLQQTWRELIVRCLFGWIETLSDSGVDWLSQELRWKSFVNIHSRCWTQFVVELKYIEFCFVKIINFLKLFPGDVITCISRHHWPQSTQFYFSVIVRYHHHPRYHLLYSTSMIIAC